MKKKNSNEHKSHTPVEFCKKCGSIMLPEKRGKSISLKCRKCGHHTKKGPKDIRIIEENPKVKGVVILEKNETMLPTTDKMCPKCEHIKAYYWLQQTRSADEPPTQFFRCVKCKHVWREYK